MRVDETTDKNTGKLLNDRQLLVHPKYKKEWSVSSANEFGQLAQGVSGRIKGTNTVFFIHKLEILKERRKDVTYGSLVCTIRPENKQNQIKHSSQRAETKLIIHSRWPHRQPKC
jgi:hypothetical protein